ncbi:MAG: hypothetical protein KDK91_23520 [Gammaproteobacteria bacterium]|nr:hypothetical protein [Gammaproteobacteria bacterium]
MLVFLDIDGVLRPMSAPAGRFHPPCLERFQSVVRDFEALEIVISSDWRWRAPRQVLLGMFAEDVQQRIIGVTPLLPGSYEGSRYREILAFIEEHRTLGGSRRVPAGRQWTGEPGQVAWLAIDDSDVLFPSTLLDRHLLLTDPESAFDEAFEHRVRGFLSRCLP